MAAAMEETIDDSTSRIQAVTFYRNTNEISLHP